MFTAKGQVTYNTVNKEVFNPYGYEIINSTVPIPQLRYTKRETCDKVGSSFLKQNYKFLQIFADWLAIALSYRPDEDPPKEIPERDAPYYNLFGHALLTKVSSPVRKESFKLTGVLQQHCQSKTKSMESNNLVVQ